LRCEELAQLERRDFLPARKGAELRAPQQRAGRPCRPREATGEQRTEVSRVKRTARS
jgi:hypothetical protein